MLLFVTSSMQLFLVRPIKHNDLDEFEFEYTKKKLDATFASAVRATK